MQLLHYSAPLPGGSGQCNSCNALPHCLGAVGSPTPAMHCLTARGQWAVELLQCTASLPGGSGQCNSCNALPHCLGALGSATSAIHCRTACRQWAVQLLQYTAALPGGSGQCNSCNALSHCPGAVGSGTLATHCLTAWEQWAVQLLQCTASLPGGSGQCNSCNGWSECSAGPVGMYYWAHRPGGMGSPTQGGGRGILQGLWGAIIFGDPGAPAWGGRGVLPRGCSEPPARANGGPSSSENRAHRPGGDGESCPGGVRSLLPGQWGAIFFREPGAPARGGRGVLPRGCSESPARPTGGHLLQRTGRTGLGGTGSPAQGVFGASCQGNGGPSSSENRAHRPGGDGESCPGGVRSLLQGRWGAIFFRAPGAPARGGRGVLPRGCSESPARPVGGHLLGVAWRGVAWWCGAVRCGAWRGGAVRCGAGRGGAWRGVAWRGVAWRGLVCGVVWCGVVWCGVVWCGVVWCGVVWCGMVWCGVVWCGHSAPPLMLELEHRAEGSRSPSGTVCTISGQARGSAVAWRGMVVGNGNCSGNGNGCAGGNSMVSRRPRERGMRPGSTATAPWRVGAREGGGVSASLPFVACLECGYRHMKCPEGMPCAWLCIQQMDLAQQGAAWSVEVDKATAWGPRLRDAS